MNPTWPATLPPLSELSEYNEQPPDTLLSTPNDAGPPKLRRRSTAGIRPVTGKMLLHRDQVQTLDAFFENTLLGGARPFDSTHPRTGAAISANLKRPTYSQISGLYYHATIALEILP